LEERDSVREERRWAKREDSRGGRGEGGNGEGEREEPQDKCIVPRLFEIMPCTG
jgi:hypothetical protein